MITFGRDHQAQRSVGLLWRALLIIGFLAGSHANGADDVDVRLRVVWGWGSARYWQGAFSIDQGRLQDIRSLGLEADEPGSLQIVGNSVAIQSPSPRNYDGFDITVRGQLDSIVTVQLSGDSTLGQPILQLPLRDLIGRIKISPIPRTKSQLVVQRAPGDKLRVESIRNAMVFRPRETWNIRIQPHLIALIPDATYRLDVRVTSAQSGKRLSEQSWNLRADDLGRVLPVDGVAIEIPEWEGVYYVELSISRTGIRNPFRSQPIERRRIQLVAVFSDKLPTRPAKTQWKEIAHFDPAQPKWWEPMTRLPHVTRLPGVDPGPVTHGNATIRSYGGRRLTELSLNAWRAYPLPVQDIGKPHVLEVEYPRDITQTMGISIVEPQTDGTVWPVGVDAGIDVWPQFTKEAGLERYQLVFWPRTKSPYVLITNRNDTSTAMFGSIRVLAGPEKLKNAVFDAGRGRLAMAHFDRPLIPEIFSASQGVDAGSGRALDDWQTFYEGGNRLVDYLQYVGYTGASISVLCEGSTIYPSSVLDPTPKYDSGVFFGTGQDPTRKDVLELLFRLFDRESLQLVPSMQFTTPLPRLTRLLRQNGEQATGLQLVSSDGESWTDSNGTRHGMAPYYNPLDRRVQNAILEAIDELIQRYGHHPSFAGLSLDLSPDSYIQLPGFEWGIDARTIARFEEEAGVDVDQSNHEKTKLQLAGEHRDAWTAWRTNIISTELLGRVHERILLANPDARLYLSGADLVDARPIQRSVWPALPRRAGIDTAMADMGLDVRALAKQGITVLRPKRLSPHARLMERPGHLEFNESADVDRHFVQDGQFASLFYHETHTLRLEDFDRKSPFGAEKTELWLFPRFSSGKSDNRRQLIRALALADMPIFFDGGWTVSLGQEHTIQPILDAFRQLPPETFSDPAESAKIDQPVVIRTLKKDRQLYAYLINDSPWPVNAVVYLTSDKHLKIQPLGNRELPSPETLPGGAAWNLSLEPFDFVACIINQPDARIESVDVKVRDVDRQRMEHRIAKLGARVAALRDGGGQIPLRNSDFELDDLSGWSHTQELGASVTLDSAQAGQGNQSVQLESTGPTAWIRSDILPTPKTGRLAVSASIRCEPALRPRIRMIVEGKIGSKTFYRFRRLTTESADQSMSEQWSEFHFRQALPLRGLHDLRIGFDLDGQGVIWIDDVRIDALSFTADEQQELNFIVAELDQAFQQLRYSDCLRGFRRYWPEFLEAHVPAESRLARLPRARSTTAAPRQAHSGKSKRSFLDRMRRIVPRWNPF